LAEDIINLYERLKADFATPIYTDMGGFDLVMNSCDPRNQALLWLASGDTRKSGDLLQRFILAIFYFRAGGSSWDFQDLWLSNDNECSWNGVVCENNSTLKITSLELGSMNIRGAVRFICHIIGLSSDLYFLIPLLHSLAPFICLFCLDRSPPTLYFCGA